MARSLKTRGLTEVSTHRARWRRQLTLKRISKPDADRAMALLDELEALIVRMRETNERGEEEA